MLRTLILHTYRISYWEYYCMHAAVEADRFIGKSVRYPLSVRVLVV